MTQIIEEERFIVEEQGNSIWPGSSPDTHIWLKVIEGPDVGLKLSVPLYSDKYSEELESQIHQFSQGDLVCLSLCRESNEDVWKITEVHPTKFN